MKFYCFTILVLIFNQIFSQDTIILKELIVNERMPDIKIHQLDSNKLKYHYNNSLNSMLDNEPSIYIKNYGLNNVSLISIRGTQAHHSKLLWNNMPINSTLSGQSNLQQIYNTQTRTLSVQYGINTLQKYSGAMGGIIDLQTIINEKEPSNTNLFFLYETLQNYSLALCNTANIGKLKTKNSFLWHNQKNRFKYFNKSILPSIKVQQQSPSNHLQYNNELFFKAKDWSITISNEFFHNKNDIPPLTTSYYKANHYEMSETYNTQSVTNIKYKNLLLLTSGIKYYKFFYLLKYKTDTCIKGISSVSEEPAFYSSLKFLNYEDSVFSIFTIAKYHYLKGTFKDNITLTYFDKNQHRFEITESIEKKWKKLSSNLILSLISANKNISLLPMLSVRKRFQSNTEIAYSVGYNIRIPYLNELYFIPGGNINLKPEKAIQSDIYLQHFFTNNVKIKIQSHFSDFDDWILWQPTSFGYWEAKNIRKIYIYGIDEIIIIKHDISKYIQINQQFRHSFIQAKGTDNQYKISHLPYIPAHTFSYTIGTTIHSCQIYQDIHYYSARFPFIYEKYIQINPYLIWNSSLYYHFSSFIAGIRIENILNTQYQSILWRAMPGRILKISLQLKINKNE